MIELLQHSIDEGILLGAYSKMDEIHLNMNRDIILKDRSKLDDMSKNKANSYDAKNIKALKNYLDRLLKYIDEDGSYEICWDVNNGLPVSYPNPLINEKAYGINTCNYIEIPTDEHLVEVDLHDLADLIAYSFMSRDLDETHDSIEELLKDCGIIGIEDSNIILNHLKDNDDEPFEFSKTFKIGNTPYYSYENKEVIDYFHSKSFNTKYYREVVDYSCKYASTIIMSTIIENSIHLGVEVKPVMINATNITFLTTMKDEFNIKNELIDDISIRIFGRKFKIEPRIEIF